MKTNYMPDTEQAKLFLELAEKYEPEIKKRPENFIRKMLLNDGMAKTELRHLENGLQPRNPLIVALGDSVTAGHFEWCMPITQVTEVMLGIIHGNSPEPMPVLEVYDVQNSYVDKFRKRLINKYETTAVSVVNAGIAGDNIRSMYNRLERDVISLKPDLVIINGTLNWNDNIGTPDDFKKILKQMVIDIKSKTDADIVLLTPNADLENNIFPIKTDLPTRIPLIREIAIEEDVCFIDVYSIWKQYAEAGHDIKNMLANGINHPCSIGHDVYAIALMKLFED